MDPLDRSWKMRNKRFPYSCTDEEGLVIWSLITHNHLRNGYELATAFGYSAIYAAAALRERGGIVRTLDCYVEELAEDFRYSAVQMEQAKSSVLGRMAAGNYPSGLIEAKECAQAAGVESAISFYVGISPTDVSAIIAGIDLDYVLIDGGHFSDQPTKEFTAINPCLADKCAVLFHDNNGNRSVVAAIREAEFRLGVKAHRFNSRYGLTLVGRGLDEASVCRCDRLLIRNTGPLPR